MMVATLEIVPSDICAQQRLLRCAHMSKGTFSDVADINLLILLRKNVLFTLLATVTCVFFVFFFFFFFFVVFFFFF